MIPDPDVDFDYIIPPEKMDNEAWVDSFLENVKDEARELGEASVVYYVDEDDNPGWMRCKYTLGGLFGGLVYEEHQV